MTHSPGASSASNAEGLLSTPPPFAAIAGRNYTIRVDAAETP